MTKLTWTAEQNKIFDFVLNDTRNGVIQAGPGCAKTTTTLESLKRYIAKFPSHKAAIMAFNVSIRKAVLEKNPELTERKEVWGINQFGNGLLSEKYGKQWVVSNKYYQLAWAYVSSRDSGYEDCKNPRSEAYRIANVVKIARESMLNFDDENDVLSFIDLHGDDFMLVHEIPLYKALISLGIAFARKHDRMFAVNQVSLGNDEVSQIAMQAISNFSDLSKWAKNWNPIIDFTDQIWLPLRWELVKPQFDMVFVDESQDLSKAKIMLALRSGKRFMFVGDKHQSMYLFAGAANDSMEMIIGESNAVELSLQTSFRLPKLHVVMANIYNPYLVAHKDNIEGELLTFENDLREAIKYMDKAANNDQLRTLVLSRTNADLTKMAITLLNGGIGFEIRGRDFGKSILSLLDNIFLGKKGEMKRGYSFDNYEKHLNDWYQKAVDDLDNKGARAGLYVALEDKYNCLLLLREKSAATTYDELCDYIVSIFEQEGSVHLILSTIHKAKGDEGEVIVIVNPEKLPFFHPKMTDESLAQEDNIHFVALTRSKQTMVEVSLPQ